MRKLFPVAATARRRGGRPGAGVSISEFSGAASLVGEGALVGAAAEEANAIYMSLSGSDTTGDGSIGSPYRSLPKVASVVSPGDTVYIRGGYYDVLGVDAYLTDADGKGPRLKFSGTEANPITVRSYPGEWAVFDGINHERWPRTSTDGYSAYEPNMIQFVGQWVNWEYLEIRNSVGRGARWFALDCKFRYLVFQACHGSGAQFQGSRNEIAYCLSQDNYSVASLGNSGNGYNLSFTDQLTLADRFPGETDSADNWVHHNVARNCSDDGFNINGAKSNNIHEHNISFENGYDTDGNGEGFKMGFAGNAVTNVFRFNIAFNTRSVAMNTNNDTHLLVHNNTHYSCGGGFALHVGTTPGSGDNEAYNNLSLYPDDGVHRFRDAALTVHTHNAGYMGRWDPGGGEGNFDTTDQDPVVMSLDWTHADFLRLGPTSPYLTAGKVITGGSTTLGAIPDGEDFAGGWDWRTLVNTYPSHGLKARSPQYPIAQGTRTPYPETSPALVGIFMSLTGDDTTGDGSESNPYRSLGKVASVVEAGDTVYIRGGYYDAVNTDTYLVNLSGSGQRIKFSGTAANPITVRSYPGEWAVFDGINHPNHPRTFNDYADAYEPRLMHFVGSWVNWEYLEFRNSVGGGPRLFSMDCKYRYLVFQNHHAVAFDLQGSRNEIAYCLFQDGFSVNNDGASANGMMLRYSDQLTQADRFPGETETGDNHIHHCVAVNNSDDGFSTNTANRSLIEYCVAFDNGYGATGDGISFKMGFSGALLTDGVARYNLAWGGGNVGFNTNYSTGVLIHNNTVWDCTSGGFALWVNGTAGSGDNEAYNNLYLGDSISIYRESGVTVHENNAAYTADWYDRPPNFALGDPMIVSLDPTSADFLRLGPTSPYLSNGKVITGGSITLGGIPDGQDFAGGWDWRALVNAYPSHGLRSRTTLNPIAQGTLTPYPGT